MEKLAKTSEASEPNFVAFRTAEQDYCIDIMDVREIRRWAPTTVLPESPAYISGVINLRGSVVPILDFSVRLGLPMSQPDERSVIIIVRVGEQTLGLLVDEVSEILNIVDEAIKPNPDIGCEKDASLISGVIALGERMIRLIDLQKICRIHNSGYI